MTMKPACRNSPASRSIATCSAIVGIEGQHHAFDLWCKSCQPDRPGGSADQGDHGIGRKPRSQQNQAIEAAFDQHHLFGEACWCVKAEPPCRVGFDPAPGSAGLVEQGLVGVLIHPWFPLEQCAPDEALPVRGTKLGR